MFVCGGMTGPFCSLKFVFKFCIHLDEKERAPFVFTLIALLLLYECLCSVSHLHSAVYRSIAMYLAFPGHAHLFICFFYAARQP